MDLTKRDKSLLIIASDFPPMVGTNTQRIQSFVRHLQKLGWGSTVVTQSIEDMHFFDLADMKQVPEHVKVVRVLNPDPFAKRRRSQETSKGGPLVSSIPVGVTTESSKTLDKTSLVKAAKDVLSHSAKWALANFAYHPDALRLWSNSAAKTVLNDIIHEQKVDVILSSSPAYSCHIAAMLVKRKTNLPWIADFRDLWFQRPYRRYRYKWHAWLDRYYEKRVVNQCDYLVLASPAWEKIFVERYGEQLRSKIKILTNGYEAEFLDSIRSKVPARQTGHKFVLTGSMHEAESPLVFLQALELLNKADAQFLADVEVCFIGNAGDHLPALIKAAKNTGLGDKIQFLSPRSNEECIKAQLGADFLIMFSAYGHEDTIRGKSFEYMATGKPILACISPKGIQFEILQRSGSAIIVPFGDVDKMVQAIKSLLNGEHQTTVRPDFSYINNFSREKIAAQLADLLDFMLKYK